MSYLQWTDNLSVGVPLMDEHHRRMIDMINVVFEAIGGNCPATIDTVLADLLEYTRLHFGEEEALMEACGFPELEEHRAEHQSLLRDVLSLRQRHCDDPAAVSLGETMDFLSKWLMRHIIAKDLRYRPYAVGHAAGETLLTGTAGAA